MINIYVDYFKNSKIENYHCDGFIIHSSEFSCYNGDTFRVDELQTNLELIKKTHIVHRLGGQTALLPS